MADRTTIETETVEVGSWPWAVLKLSQGHRVSHPVWRDSKNEHVRKAYLREGTAYLRYGYIEASSDLTWFGRTLLPEPKPVRLIRWCVPRPGKEDFVIAYMPYEHDWYPDGWFVVTGEEITEVS